MDPDKKQRVVFISVAAVAGIALGLFFWWSRMKGGGEAEVPFSLPPPAAAPAAPAEPEIQHPLADAAPAGSASTSSSPEQVNSELQSSLKGLFGDKAVADYLVPDDLVRHIVATVDNLAREKAPIRVRPVVPVPGRFAVSQADDAITLDAANDVRYRAFVQLVSSADAKQVAATYKQFYPRFQQSYQELGYPNAYFNDRVVEVIDHLLETPEVQGPIRLVQPRVFYEFSDPSLEKRSAGQKTLIRMGSENSAKVKQKLREIRSEIAKPAGSAG